MSHPDPGIERSARAVGRNSVNLSAVTDDVTALRRYLGDAGLLTRTADGKTYARAVA
ncbi:DUF2087 domain-containing protein [Microbacterium sp. NPDC090007]|uniref:DUF2087 domain-containing protein n=1 Tax=Microbacterium sp. NPDC090007 TaxID=3364204 RepID=UPI0038231830